MSDGALPPIFEFYKLACGAVDFLLWDLTESPTVPSRDELGGIAEHICRRRTGVGASGLLVLRQSEAGVEPLLFRPGHPDTEPTYPALLCAAKYLFGGARFGRSTLHLRVGDHAVGIVPVDSLSMAADLEFATSRKRPVEGAAQLRPRLFLGGRFTLKGIPMETRAQRALLFFQPELGSPHPRRWRRSVFRVRWRGYRPVVVQLVGPRQLNLDYAPTEDEPDTVALAGMAAQAAYLSGLVDIEVVIRCGDHPYFVTLHPASRSFRVMVPIRYVFKGSYSESDHFFS